MVVTQAPEAAWSPAADIAVLRARAVFLQQIRAFFAAREVLEVTTPVLAAGASCDPQIESFRVDGQGGWLQTSPEFHMKRLLAAGSGPIYQIATAFRREEQGRWHNPEFSLLEWYRPGFDEQALMDECAALWCELAGQDAATGLPRYRYAELIEQHLGLAWHQLSPQRLRQALQPHLGELPGALDLDGLLDAAMGLHIGPRLGLQQPCFVFDFPPSQAALARLHQGSDGQPWACRFELYWQGLELANGFYELRDAQEQQRRFEADQARRRRDGQAVPDMDQALLAALRHGLPDCAGVALGLDRLFALLLGKTGLAEVLAFPADRA